MEYSRVLVNGGLNYFGIWGRYGRWRFSFFDISVIHTRRISDSFKEYLETLKQNGNNLYQSFNPGIINNITFSYLHNDNDITLNKNSKYYYFGIEFGGLFYTIGRLANTEWGDASLKENEVFGLPYYEYTKLNLDIRKYLPISKSSSLNFRLNTGIAISYNANEDLSLPYEKFYFAGGLNSVRAWEARRLGPGSYAYQDSDGNYTYQFEQPGEIILEGSLEYRTKLFAFIQGAAFVDIGNVWMIHEDIGRPNAEFKKNSIPSEIAVGTGVGLRLDFSFLIVRWDVGVKMWDPALQEIPKWSNKNKIVHNFGIGYPFLEMNKKEIEDKFKKIQDSICSAIEKCDHVNFKEDNWIREEGGGGRTRVLENGSYLEKGGVNFSAVQGKTPKKIIEALKIEEANFYATGVSIVMHPKNPHIPIIHMNIRYFEMQNGIWWFGGGIDLTPHLIDEKQAAFFHNELKSLCNKYDKKFYTKFKNWADDYFYIKHRKETRGIGGIFFDRLNSDSTSLKKKNIFDFVCAVGTAFIPIYTKLIEENKHKKYTERMKEWQYIRRSRYAEFNLVYDKGTKFGLDTDGRIESILMSMPPLASWRYDVQLNEEEKKTNTLLKKGKNWAL